MTEASVCILAFPFQRTLIKDFGPDWRSLVASFDDQPFAAASIGQVHQAILHDGRSVAMKIQYPGVAEGIESDITNLVSTLSVANILPEGEFYFFCGRIYTDLLLYMVLLLLVMVSRSRLK